MTSKAPHDVTHHHNKRVYINDTQYYTTYYTDCREGNKSRILLFKVTLCRAIVGAAVDPKLLDQEFVDELAFRILALLDGQELRQLGELLQGEGSIWRSHLVPVGSRIVRFTETGQELKGQFLVLPESVEVVVFLHPVDLDDREDPTVLRTEVVGVYRREVGIVTLERAVLEDHLVVVGTLHARGLGLLEAGVVGASFDEMLNGEEMLDLSVEFVAAHSVGTTGH